MFQGMAQRGQAIRPSKRVDEFDDVLYGSESESETDDEQGDEVGFSNVRKHRKYDVKGWNSQGGVKLRLDNDEPMDLLEGVGMRIEGECTSSNYWPTDPVDLVATNYSVPR
jgi:ribosomal RNA-processing protein 12